MVKLPGFITKMLSPLGSMVNVDVTIPFSGIETLKELKFPYGITISLLGGLEIVVVVCTPANPATCPKAPGL